MKVSNCCRAEVIKNTIIMKFETYLSGRDGGHVCSKCHKPCEVREVKDEQ